MLRIEDTDRTRLVDGSVENMLAVLAEVNLIPDEGPNNPGELGPYYQSERLDIYKKYIDQLIEQGDAYRCFCTSERLDAMRSEQQELNLPTKYDQTCRYLSEEEIQENLDNNIPYTVRLKVPKDSEVTFEDTVKWKITVATKDIDDQVLMKTDGFPTYHMAAVVDDHLMGITHVIRGDEWVPSTPKHILIHEALGWEAPIFSHLPLLLGTDKKKLSKRTGDVSVEIYLEKGYLQEALINYISLLGWNPKTTEEFFTLPELIERFDLSAVHKSWAVFDVERLNFFNAKYLKEMEIDTLLSKFKLYLSRYDTELLGFIDHQDEAYIKKILSEIKTRMLYFSEFKNLTTFFFDEPNTAPKDVFINEKMKIADIEGVKTSLQLSLEVLKSQKNDFDTVEDIKNTYITAIKNAEMKNGQVLWPTRVALSGERFSPGALEMIYILWVGKSIERIEKVLKDLS